MIKNTRTSLALSTVACCLFFTNIFGMENQSPLYSRNGMEKNAYYAQHELIAIKSNELIGKFQAFCTAAINSCDDENKKTYRSAFITIMQEKEKSLKTFTLFIKQCSLAALFLHDTTTLEDNFNYEITKIKDASISNIYNLYHHDLSPCYQKLPQNIDVNSFWLI